MQKKSAASRTAVDTGGIDSPGEFGSVVADLMSTDVVVATPDMTLKEVDELFTFNQISGAPVVEDSMLVGVISQTDIIRVLYDEQVASTHVSDYFMSPFPIALPSVNALAKERAKIASHMVDMKVSQVMTPVPITVGPNDRIRDAAQKMLDAQIHRLLVVDDDEVVGVLSALDLVKLVATDW